MSDEFDPYQQWLGIAKHEQPPNYYRLLGVADLMDDVDAIGNAADRQMNFVRTFQLGKHAEKSQKLLRELAKAKLCLLNAGSKAEYDAGLREARRPPAASGPAPPKPVAPPAPRISPSAPVPAPEPVEAATEPRAVDATMPSRAMPRRTVRSGLPQWVWYGLAGVMTLAVLVWVVARISNSRKNIEPTKSGSQPEQRAADLPEPPSTSSVVQNVDGTVSLLAALAEPVGNHAALATEAGETFITGLESQSDAVQWAFALEKGKRGAFRVEIEYACPEGAEGGEFTIAVNGKQVRGTHGVRPTGGATVFHRVVIGYIKATQLDGNTLKLAVKSPIPSGTTIMNVRSVRLKLEQKGGR